MRGEIVAFDAGVGEGEIAGDDFARYRFKAADARSPALLRTGARVEFLAFGGQALEISLLAGSAPPVDTKGHFDLGRVIQRTFTSIGQNWKVYFGAATLLVGVPGFIMSWGQTNALGASAGAATAAIFGGLILYVVGFFLLQGMVLKAAINGFNGKPTPFGRAFDAAVSKVLPLIGLAILTFLALMVGFLFFIAPGIFLCVIWSVTAPSLVVEQRGVFESFTRSADLTKGHRWSVLGLLAIYVAMSWIVSLVGAGIGLALSGFGATGVHALPLMIFNTLVNIITGVGASVGAASLYYELRTAKEGVGAEDLASVFD
jgi:hypothetical protein